MLYYIKGILAEKKQDSAVIDVNGIGFDVFISGITYLSLPDKNKEVMLYLYTQVREDDIYLYGFSTLTEKAILKLLISVSGIGLKLAKNILSNVQMEELINAVVTKNVERLSYVPGIGKRGAEKIIVELKEKIANLSSAGHAVSEKQAVLLDAVSALINLGYKHNRSKDAVEALLNDNPSIGIEEVIKLSLKRLSK